MANLVNFEAKHSDACYLNQADTMSLIMSITPGITPSTPQLGVYIDLYQYRNNGGVYPDGDYIGLNPNMRAANINTILPSLDKFYFFSKLKFTPTVSYTSAPISATKPL